MAASRIMEVAVAVEALLAGVAIIWIGLRALPVAVGHPGTGLVVGLGAAGLLAVANYGVLRMAPPIGPVREIRRLYHETLRPLFSDVTALEAAVVGMAAGAGEELLFRGAVQAEFGLVAASVLFGLAHVGGRSSMIFGVWVTVMGFGLGALVLLTRGLMAPMVAHAAYDAAAIMYMRRDRAIDRGSAA